MEYDETQDRRKYPRVKTEALVSICRVNRDEVVGHAQDISIGGIRFRCVGLEVEPGELLRVTLNLEGSVINVIGEVTRVTDLDVFTQEFALGFLEVEPETVHLLESLTPEG